MTTPIWSVLLKTRIVRIGNSRGVRLPKLLLDQTGLPDEVEVEAQGDRLIIRPARAPRAGWAEAFASMAAEDDDSLLDDATPPTAFDREHWTW
ncbi:MAG: AbrB/MazE/SpoVT family DNA-binding domain-containing protein [Gemmatimonadales bacterium]